MAVNLSPIWGAGAQLFDNSGNVLSGGKIYTYAAGTTTPATTYTSSSGITANSNPIILNSAGRVPYEIWLSDTVAYKFVLKDSNDTLIATYDNLVGINSNFIAYTAQQEIQTATAGQTVFNLTTMQYQPGTNNLSVFVDGVNQYGPGAQYAYVETDSDTVTFVNGLHVGASVKFTTASPVAGAVMNAENVAYDPPFTGAVGTNVEAKLAQTISVKDFGAVGDGVTDDTQAIQDAIDYVNSVGGGKVLVPDGMKCVIDSNLTVDASVSLEGPHNFVGSPGNNTSAPYENVSGSLLLNSAATITLSSGSSISGLLIYRKGMTFPASNASLFAGTAITLNGDDCSVDRCMILGFAKAIYSSNSQRPTIQNVLIDCSAGVEITVCYDIPRLNNIHCWPFTTVAASGNATRSGSAFYLHNSVDGPMLANCFAYGYLNGFYFKNISSVSVTNCFADNTGSYTGSAGWRFEGDINGFHSASCVAYSCSNGVVVNTNLRQFVPIMGFTCNNSTNAAFNIVQGNSDIFNNNVYIATSLVDVNQSSSIVNIRDNSFASISVAPVVLNASTNNVFIGQNTDLDSSTNSLVSSNDTVNTVASADPLPIRNYGDVFNVTGTTSFGRLPAGWAGRKITLIFGDAGLVVTSAVGNRAYMRLAGNVNFTSTGGATLTLVHNGVQWFEIGRSV